ncbi:MAG: transporter substrate-binding domain-containing protein [Pseudomonadota bacterium]
MKKLLLSLFLITLALPAWAGDTKESAFDRVMRTNTIRCGWLVYPPFFSKDINTGKLTGLTVETMEAIGAAANLKIEWTEEVSMTTAFEAINTGRFDMACIPFWITLQRVRVSQPSVPLYFDGYYAFSRKGDTRFKNGYNALNNKDVSISVQEGAAIQEFLPQRLPNAKISFQPSLSGPMLQLQDVMTKKADVAFVEMSLFRDFEKMNPNILVAISKEPFVTMPAALWIPQNDPRLTSLINESIKTLKNNGTMEDLLNKYGGREIFSFVRKPYE